MKAYYFPGLGADETLEPNHRIVGIEAQWIKWPSEISPSWDQFLTDLFRENEIEEGALFLGISFGGLVAAQVAKRKKPTAIILIGSLTTPKAVSPLFRNFRGLLPAIPGLLFNLGWVPKQVIAYFFGIKTQDHLTHFFRMAKGYTPHQTKGLVQLALSAPPMEKGLSLFAIHGNQDRILPARNREPGYLVKGGGHLLSMTHSEEVNAAILNWIKNQKWARE